MSIRVWVQRRSNKRFLCLDWIDPHTGKRHTKSSGTADRRQAERAAQRLEDELNAGRYAPAGRMLFETFVALYLEHLAGRSATHRAKARRVLREFAAVGTVTTTAQINERSVSRLLQSLAEKRRQPTTVKGCCSYLRSAFRWGWEHGYLHRVPTIHAPKRSSGHARVRIVKASRITQEHFERLEAKCPDARWRLLIAFAWYAGLRRSELFRLEGSQLDLQRHTIAIGKPKSGNVAETAFIPPPLEALIGTLWPRALPKDRLFGLVTNVEDLSRVFGSIAKAAMVPGNSKDGWATLQDLRRAFGSRWSARVPAQVLQRIMRHSNIQVTLSFYAETDDAALQAIRNVAPSVARECGE